jgi:hypothetical protein
VRERVAAPRGFVRMLVYMGNETDFSIPLVPGPERVSTHARRYRRCQ